MPEEGGQSDAGGEGGGLMTGNRGWIIVLAVVILEAAFFIVLLKFKSDNKPADTNVGGGLSDQTISDFIFDKIKLEKLNYSIPTPSGQSMTLAMDLVLVMGRTEKEIKESIVLTPQDWATFKDAITQMVPWVQDQLNRTVNKMSASELGTDRGQDQIRSIVKERINSKLRSMKWDKLSNPKIDPERITEVWITNWYLN